MTRDTQTRKGGPRKPTGSGKDARSGRPGPRHADSRSGSAHKPGSRKPDSRKPDADKREYGKGGFGKQDRAKRSFDKPAAGAASGGREGSWQKFGSKPGRPDRPGASAGRPDRDGGARVLRRPERPAQDWDNKPRGYAKDKPKTARPPAPAKRSEDTPEGERVAKVIARAGLCSRRDAELWIEAGRVSVNGNKLESAAFNVKPDDKILVDGEPLGARERTRLFLFHKPRGVVTTARDPEGRTTIYDVLPDDLPRVVTVGRLDINTEGLLLLTNDGGLARVMELPDTGWLRRYRVRAHGHADAAALERLADGVTIDGVEYRGIEARVDRQQGDNVWISIGLREGKNREIKRVLEHIGLAVNRLIRVSFGPFQLNELAEGAVEEIRTRILQDQLGEKLAQEAGADFEAPIFLHGVSEPEDEPAAMVPRARPDRPGRSERDERPRGRDDARSDPREGSRGAPRSGERFARPRDDGPRSGFDRRKSEEEAPKRLGKPEAPKRKHVRIMREEAASDPRRLRSESGEVQDRRGRRVVTEKRVSAAPRKAREDTDFNPREERAPRTERSANPRKPFGDGPGRGKRPEGERAGRTNTDRPGQSRAGQNRAGQNGPATDRSRTDRSRPDGTRADHRKTAGKSFAGKSDRKPFEKKPFDSRRGDDSAFRGKIKGKDATRFDRDFDSADKPKRSGPPRSGPPRSGPPRSGPARSGPPRSGPARSGSDSARPSRGERPAPRRPRRDD